MKNVLVVHDAAGEMCRALEEAVPGYRFQAAETADAAIATAADAQILMGLAPRLSERLIAAMPKLEWVHALTTGYDNLLMMPSLKPEIAISCSRGIHGPQMAELAILLMMSLARRFPQVMKNQQQRNWERWPQPLLLHKTVCLVGVGVIAEALAERLLPFGARLTGVSDGRSEIQGFDRIYRRNQIAHAAADADFLVVIVPYSDETHHLVDDRVLDAMKPSAYLVNISRGGCVDEEALIARLRKQAIAGAGLDVFATEPLPTESALWSLPNVIVTPHIGGFSDIYHHQVLPITVENLHAYARQGAAGLQNRVR